MRLQVPTLDETRQIVRDLIAQAKAAPTLAESAYLMRLARIKSE